jgi:hypothetical protein
VGDGWEVFGALGDVHLIPSKARDLLFALLGIRTPLLARCSRD